MINTKNQFILFIGEKMAESNINEIGGRQIDPKTNGWASEGTMQDIKKILEEQAKANREGLGKIQKENKKTRIQSTTLMGMIKNFIAERGKRENHREYKSLFKQMVSGVDPTSSDQPGAGYNRHTSVKNRGKALWTFMKQIGRSALVLTGLITAVTLVSKALYESYQALHKLADFGLDGVTSMTNLSKSAAAAGMGVGEYADMLIANGAVIQQLSSKYENGQLVFAKLTRDAYTASKEFLLFGMNTAKVTEYMAEYLDIQRMTGMLTKQSLAEQATAGALFIKQVDEFAGIMGKSRKEILKDSKAMFEQVDVASIMNSLEGASKASFTEFVTLASSVDKEVGDMMSAMIGNQLTGLSPIMDGFQSIFNTIGGGVAQEAFDDLNNKIRNGVKGSELSDALGDFFNAVNDDPNLNWDQLAQWSKVGSEEMKKVASMFIKIRHYSKDQLKDLDKKAKSDQSLAQTIDQLVQAFRDLKSTAIVAFMDVLGNLTGKLDTLKTGVENMAKAVAKWTNDIIQSDNPWETLKSQLKELMFYMVSAVADAVDRYLGEALGDMYDSRYEKEESVTAVLSQLEEQIKKQNSTSDVNEKEKQERLIQKSAGELAAAIKQFGDVNSLTDNTKERVAKINDSGREFKWNEWTGRGGQFARGEGDLVDRLGYKGHNVDALRIKKLEKKIQESDLEQKTANSQMLGQMDKIATKDVKTIVPKKIEKPVPSVDPAQKMLVELTRLANKSNHTDQTMALDQVSSLSSAYSASVMNPNDETAQAALQEQVAISRQMLQVLKKIKSAE